MQKSKRIRFVFTAIVIFSLIVMYGYTVEVDAASLESAKITLSDSDGGASATSTIVVDFGDTNPLTPGEFIRILYDSNFGDPGGATLTCPTDTTASSTVGLDWVECVVDAGMFLEATSTQTVTLVGLANPAAEGADYDVTASTHETNETEIESTPMKVYILDQITVSATVDATLSFSVALLGPYSTRSTINGISLTGTSTANSLAFGTLDPTSSTTLGHELSVGTNAADGYTVTVQQDGNLQNAGGDTINSFSNSFDGYGTTTPIVWEPPLATIGNAYTYGHMGVTTEDDNLAGEDFTSSKYAGINGVAPMEVMYNSSPSDSTTENSGLSAVAYTVDISVLQEPGDYTSILTYVCTPTY